jgi:type II secretory pathway component GspD/PulD (secretin)
VDALIKLIEETVDAPSWRDNGGAVGMIREFGGMLVVTQTAENHRKIKDLLNQLPEQQSRLVRVRVDWLYIEPDQVKFEGMKTSGALREIDRASLDKLPKDVMRFRAETTCFTGQTVSLRSARQQAYVSDLNPIVGTQAVAYDPAISILSVGIVLQVTPTLQVDGQSAVLDVHSTIGDPAAMKRFDLRGGAVAATTQEVGSGGGLRVTGDNAVDLPNLFIQRLDTTLRVPLAKTIIVGGMTCEPQAGAMKQILLLVEITGGESGK